jgi:hypothetical protein
VGGVSAKFSCEVGLHMVEMRDFDGNIIGREPSDSFRACQDYF